MPTTRKKNPHRPSRGPRSGRRGAEPSAPVARCRDQQGAVGPQRQHVGTAVSGLGLRPEGPGQSSASRGRSAGSAAAQPPRPFPAYSQRVPSGLRASTSAASVAGEVTRREDQVERLPAQANLLAARRPSHFGRFPRTARMSPHPAAQHVGRAVAGEVTRREDLLETPARPRPIRRTPARNVPGVPSRAKSNSVPSGFRASTSPDPSPRSPPRADDSVEDAPAQPPSTTRPPGSAVREGVERKVPRRLAGSAGRAGRRRPGPSRPGARRRGLGSAGTTSGKRP